jgi:peroxiredoxin
VSAPGAGSLAPAFVLLREDQSPFTEADLDGRTTVLVFFPLAFSPVCTDQFTLYQEVLDDLRAQGADLYGVSCDSTYSLHAFREQLGVQIPMLSDFHPKGEATRAWGLYREPDGFPERAIVITGPDRTVRTRWVGEHPGVLPGANVIFDGLAGTTAGG